MGRFPDPPGGGRFRIFAQEVADADGPRKRQVRYRAPPSVQSRRLASSR